MNKRGFAGDQDGQFLRFVLTLQESQAAAARPIAYSLPDCRGAGPAILRRYAGSNWAFLRVMRLCFDRMEQCKESL